MIKRLLIILFGMVGFTHLFSQDACSPIGWATMNGGVTGGGNANPTVVRTYSELASALGNESVRVVHISGTIDVSGNRITIQDQSDKTIFGLPGSKLVTTDYSKSGSGIFYIKRCSNFILQNIVFEGAGAYDTDGYDNLCIDNSTNFWVDHCEFHDGTDGNFDIKNMADNISVTWCTFSYEKPPIPGGSGGSDDHRYTNLIGSSASATDDRNKLNTTFQYCWWGNGCRERMPRVRFGKIHLLNNYFSSSVANYCARAGEEANILIEGNYFENQSNPVDLYKSNAIVAEYNNISTRGSINTQNAGNVFDPPYNYTIADPSTIVSLIRTCAGAKLSSWGGCSSCSGDVNIPPSVTITAPSNNSIYSPGETITINATASDSDGNVNYVTFYDGSNELGVSNFGYSFTWSDAEEGIHTITAVATDNEGASTTSPAISVIVSQEYTIVVSVNGAGDVSPHLEESYYSGSQLSVSAIEYIGSSFTGWTGDVTSSDKILSFTVSRSMSIVANFTANSSYNVFEIEDGTYQSGIADFEDENAGFSGRGYVNTANERGTWVEITVYAQNSGTYNCDLFYASISDRPLSISVNGTEQITSLPMPNTGDWTAWTNVPFLLEFTEGENTIRFTATGSEGAPNLDKIHLQAENVVIENDVNLHSGWNLVGFPHESDMEIENVLADIWDKVLAVKNMDAFYSKSQAPYLNSLTIFEWSCGYFIYVSEDCSFNW